MTRLLEQTHSMKLILGDCLEVMKKMESNSIDTIITDPPYGLSFMGKKWDYDVPSVDVWKEALRVLKPGGTALIFAGSRTQHRMAVNVEDAGFILKDCIMWLYGSGFPKATDISKQLDKGHERKVVGTLKTNTKMQGNNYAGTKPDLKGGVVNITTPATDEAKLWNGWKSHGLKPAYEPILVAVKPNDGSYAENAIKWGVSGLNIEGGRIEHNDPLKETNRQKNNGNTWDSSNTGLRNNPGTIASASPQGRFPANIILDEQAGQMLDEQSGIQASRFFYTAKASKSERNAGLEHLEDKDPAVFDFRPTLRTNPENWKTLISETPYGRGGQMKNNHPTVKPLKLMEYLCTLTKTPTGGVVLDPFMGSGTTGVACKNTGRDFIGIELDPEYLKIAKARIGE